jgi:hypothetical protein
MVSLVQGWEKAETGEHGYKGGRLDPEVPFYFIAPNDILSCLSSFEINVHTSRYLPAEFCYQSG